MSYSTGKDGYKFKADAGRGRIVISGNISWANEHFLRTDLENYFEKIERIRRGGTEIRLEDARIDHSVLAEFVYWHRILREAGGGLEISADDKSKEAIELLRLCGNPIPLKN